jgi:DNA repair protein RadA/Sms
LQFGGNDIYLNVAGGLRISEPAADLAVAAALISSVTGCPVPADTLAFGEIGLSGEIRPVGRTELRLKEAEKLGFGAALMPKRRTGATNDPKAGGLRLLELDAIEELPAFFDAGGHPARLAGGA